MLGDELLDNAANALRKLINQSALDPAKPELYIRREYHVEAFHDSELKYTYNNILRKIRNNLTAALNKFPTVLPEYVVILVGNSYVHDHTFVETEMKPILKKVFNDVTRLLSTRREQLPLSLQGVKSTQVYMIRPLPKPAIALKGDQKFKNTRRYLNQMLDNLSRTCDFQPLNIDEINCSQRALFEKNGSLSDFGKERLWISINDFIETKDLRIKSAVRKSCARKTEVATQGKPDMITAATQPRSGEPIEEYYTAEQTSSADRERRSQDQWAPYPRRTNFDDFHRRYDRAQRFDRDQHYNY